MQRRMILRQGLALALAAALAPALALADDGRSYQARVQAELRSQGFTRMQVSRTWLGRVRIEAQSKDEQREVVLDPHTGEILRDYTSALTTGKPDTTILHDGGGGGHDGGSSGSGSSGDSSSSSSSGDSSSSGEHEQDGAEGGN